MIRPWQAMAIFPQDGREVQVQLDSGRTARAQWYVDRVVFVGTNEPIIGAKFWRELRLDQR